MYQFKNTDLNKQLKPEKTLEYNLTKEQVYYFAKLLNSVNILYKNNLLTEKDNNEIVKKITRGILSYI